MHAVEHSTHGPHGNLLTNRLVHEVFAEVLDTVQAFDREAVTNTMVDRLNEWPLIGAIVVDGKLVGGNGSGFLTCYASPLKGVQHAREENAVYARPFGGSIVLFDRAQCPYFQHVVASVVCDYANGGIWQAWRCSQGVVPEYRSQFRRATGGPISQLFVQSDTFEPRSISCISHLSDADLRERAVSLCGPNGRLLCDDDATAIAMARVADGTISAYICDHQSHVELAAGYALVCGANGQIVRWDGRSIHGEPFNPDAEERVILAANESLIETVREQISM